MDWEILRPNSLRCFTPVEGMVTIDRKTEVFSSFWFVVKTINRVDMLMGGLVCKLKQEKKYLGERVCFIYEIFEQFDGELLSCALIVKQNTAYKATRIDKELRCWHTRF